MQICMRIVVGFLLVVAAPGGLAGDWPMFRGPQGLGIADVTDVPLRWSDTENVAWKTPVPGDCNGSAIVSNGKVFVTAAEDKGRQRHLICLDLQDGTQDWIRTAEFDKVMPTHKTNLYAGTTPAADGRHVVVWRGSAGLACYDFEGNGVWTRELGEFRHQWGYGTSPVLLDDKVILHSGPGARVFIAAFDISTGETLWRHDEPVENDGDTNDAGKYMGSWSTPVVVRRGDQKLVVCSMATRVIALDADSGELIWNCDGIRGDRGDLAYTSPVIHEDICVCMAGFTGPAMGFRMHGTGNITDPSRLWRVPGKNPQRIGSGVIVDGLLYMANAGPNIIQCLEPETGEVRWQQRSAAGAHWGSTVFAAGHLFATGQNGSTIVFRPDADKFEQVAVNRLNESTNSTPAFVDGRIVIRTFDHVYCIGD